MKPIWSKSEEKVVAPLRDGQWHCIYNEVQLKDDRARLSAIRRKLAPLGYTVDSEPCTIHNHESRILMRRIVKTTTPIPSPHNKQTCHGCKENTLAVANW